MYRYSSLHQSRLDIATFAASCAAIGLVAASAGAATPKMGGGMKHIMITVENQTVQAMIDGDPNEHMILYNYGETYDPPADVLNNTSYNSRYGWMADGFIQIPPDAGIFIECLEQTPGLMTYESETFSPIFGTEHAPMVWEWSGRMTHNWYAANELQDFDATYRVYVGDANGDPLPDWQPDELMLHFTAQSCLMLDIANLKAGARATFTVNGAGAIDGEHVVVVYGTHPGTTRVNNLNDYCATFGIRSVSTKRIVVQGAIQNGMLQRERLIPGIAKGTSLYLQAARRHTCPVECTSNIVNQVVQ